MLDLPLNGTAVSASQRFGQRARRRWCESSTRSRREDYG